MSGFLVPLQIGVYREQFYIGIFAQIFWGCKITQIASGWFDFHVFHWIRESLAHIVIPCALISHHRHQCWCVVIFNEKCKCSRVLFVAFCFLLGWLWCYICQQVSCEWLVFLSSSLVLWTRLMDRICNIFATICTMQYAVSKKMTTNYICAESVSDIQFTLCCHET